MKNLKIIFYLPLTNCLDIIYSMFFNQSCDILISKPNVKLIQEQCRIMDKMFISIDALNVYIG